MRESVATTYRYPSPGFGLGDIATVDPTDAPNATPTSGLFIPGWMLVVLALGIPAVVTYVGIRALRSNSARQ